MERKPFGFGNAFRPPHARGPRQRDVEQQPAVNTARIERATAAGAEQPYVAPAGFPADPQAWLDYLKAGQFTAEQEKYLRSNAFAIYVMAINSARSNPDLAEAVALGDQIIAVWSAWLLDNPATPVSNPFGG